MNGFRKVFVMVAVVCSLVFTTTSASAAALKILSVDVSRVFEEYEDAKKSRISYSEEVAAANKEFREMYDAVIKLQEEIGSLNEKSENQALLDSVREKFRNEVAEKMEVLRMKEEELIQFRNEANRKLSERRNKDIAKQSKEIEDAAATIAKSKKADIVLTRIPSTLYVDDSLDITQSVIDKLNERQR